MRYRMVAKIVLYLHQRKGTRAHLARRTDTTGSNDQPLNEDEDQTSNKGSGRRQRRNYKWKATKLEKAQESLQFSGSDLSVPVDESLSYPIDYFRHFFY